MDGLVLENKNRDGAPGKGSNPCCYGTAARVEETIDVVYVVWGVVVRGEDRVDDQAARSALNNELFLGLQRLFNVRGQSHVHVNNGILVLVTEEGEEAQRLWLVAKRR